MSLDPTNQDLSEIITKATAQSVADAVARLSEAIVAKGMQIFAIIDHSGEAKAVGLDLRDTKLVIFGSPRAGTPVMAYAPLSALDLPLKVLVWDHGGQTKVSYTAPDVLAARYALTSELAQIRAPIDALTDSIIIK